MPRDVAKIARKLARGIKAGAPPNACSGEWMQTIEQAAVSSGRGGFADSAGSYVPSAHDSELFDAIREAVEEIHLAGDRSWNVARIGWRPGDLAVTIDTIFDPEIVPRAPDDPVYEEAATARRDFWNAVGGEVDGYLGDAAKANDHGQTRWFSPHRRLMRVELAGRATLVTDGLSTPWPGVLDKVNGSEIEVFLENPNQHASMEPWINVLLDVGDMIADDRGIESDVVRNGAVIFCGLTDTVAPYTHLVLSVPADNEPAFIPSLPYGRARLLKATAVTLDDLAGHSLDGWAVEAARQALARRRESGGAL